MKSWLFALFWRYTLHAHAAIEVAEHRAVGVQVARDPQRVVTLLPSLAVSPCSLVARARFVRIDSFSNWPEPLRRQCLREYSAGVAL